MDSSLTPWSDSGLRVLGGQRALCESSESRKEEENENEDQQGDGKEKKKRNRNMTKMKRKETGDFKNQSSAPEKETHEV